MHLIVFELTSDGKDQWEGVLNNVENVREALGPDDTQVEVVLHAKGIGLVLAATGDDELQSRVRTLAGQGVVFAACSNTMKKRDLSREDLLAEAVVVDSGVAQVVRRQEQGWSYIKAGH